MEDKYTVLARQALFTSAPADPAEATAAMLLRQQDGSLCAVLKLHVRAEKPISAIGVRLFPKWKGRNALTEPIKLWYTDIHAACGDTLGENIPLALPEMDADGLTAEVAAVRFADGSSWVSDHSLSGAAGMPAGPAPEAAKPAPAAEPVRSAPAAEAARPASDEQSAAKETIEAASATATMERPKKAEKTPLTPEQKAKRKKIGLISGASAAGVAVVLLILFLLVPVIRYASANKAMESGDYARAEEIYIALDDFRSSRSRRVMAGAMREITEGSYESGIRRLTDKYNPVSVNYDVGEGSFADPATEAKQTLARDGFSGLPEAERDYYQFDGWTLTDSRFTLEKELGAAELQFSAVFVPINYTISYENLGDGSVSAPTEYTVESAPITLAAPSRTGYDFTGWSGSGSGETVTIPTGSHGNLRYRANWEAKTYSVTLDAAGESPAEGETLPSGSISLTYGKEFELPVMEKRGYDFKGWTDGKTIFSSGLWTNAADCSLTPSFELSHYSITYDIADGKMNGTNPTSYTMMDADITISDASRLGYKFLGWTLNGENAGDPAVLPTGSVGDVVFRALWQGNPHTVTLDPNGGSVSATTCSVVFGSPYTLPTPYKTGYDFTGWSNGSKSYTQGTWNEDNDVRVTAGWTPKKFNVPLNSAGGSGAASSISVTYGSSYSLPTPSRKGYDFKGWMADGVPYSGGIWDTDGAPTLVAQWEGKHYTVSLNAAGGEVFTTSYPVTYGSEYTLPTPTRKGYTFTGWSTSSYGSITPTTGVWNTDSNVSLTARWEVKTCHIYLDANGGKFYFSGDNVETVKYGNRYYLSTPSRDGYTFEGWLYNGMEFPTSGTFEYDDDVYVQAQWKGRSYSVSLRANGGSVSPGSVSVTYGEAYSLPIPTRSGYQFDGWYTYSSGGDYYPVSGVWTQTSGEYLYAHWTKES